MYMNVVEAYIQEINSHQEGPSIPIDNASSPPTLLERGKRPREGTEEVEARDPKRVKNGEDEDENEKEDYIKAYNTERKEFENKRDSIQAEFGDKRHSFLNSEDVEDERYDNDDFSSTRAEIGDEGYDDKFSSTSQPSKAAKEVPRRVFLRSSKGLFWMGMEWDS